MLGIPTVADRIAQSVVKARLEPVLEPLFHADSYGYRPGRSALDAVGAARQRCWRSNWVLDLDIKAFFDSIDTELLMRAVCKHATSRWEVLYIERWLKAPVQMPDGTIVARTRGTPQGGVLSPLLANLFLHYAFDVWMTRHFPAVRFERYADDLKDPLISRGCICMDDEVVLLNKGSFIEQYDRRNETHMPAVQGCQELSRQYSF
jgi:group II intron reverse transcriptase/maturase